MQHLITRGLAIALVASTRAWTPPRLEDDLPSRQKTELGDALVQELSITDSEVLAQLRNDLQVDDTAPVSTALPLIGASYDADGWNRVIDRHANLYGHLKLSGHSAEQMNPLPKPGVSYDAAGWDRVINRHANLSGPQPNQLHDPEAPNDTPGCSHMVNPHRHSHASDADANNEAHVDETAACRTARSGAAVEELARDAALVQETSMEVEREVPQVQQIQELHMSVSTPLGEGTPRLQILQTKTVAKTVAKEE